MQIYSFIKKIKISLSLSLSRIYDKRYRLDTNDTDGTVERTAHPLVKMLKIPGSRNAYGIPGYIVVSSVPVGRVRQIAPTTLKFHERLTGRTAIYADKGAKL